jgi:hypothetical protein
MVPKLSLCRQLLKIVAVHCRPITGVCAALTSQSPLVLCSQLAGLVHAYSHGGKHLFVFITLNLIVVIIIILIIIRTLLVFCICTLLLPLLALILLFLLYIAYMYIIILNIAPDMPLIKVIMRRRKRLEVY